METQAFTEQGSPPHDATKLRNNRFAWFLGVGLVLWVLSLLSFLMACLLVHHKQSPKPCWFHASFPASLQAAQEAPDGSQDTIRWTWINNCSSSAVNTKDFSSLEILESGVYFAYIYVACKETACFEGVHFTVHLADNSDKPLSVLRGPNITPAFVSLGRPFFLQKGTHLRLAINENLKYIDINQTHWGLYKI